MYIKENFLVVAPPERGVLYFYYPVVKDGEIILIPLRWEDEVRRLIVPADKKGFFIALFNLISRVREIIAEVDTSAAEFAWVYPKSIEVHLPERKVMWHYRNGETLAVDAREKKVACSCATFKEKGVCGHLKQIRDALFPNSLPIPIPNGEIKGIKIPLPEGVNWVEYLFTPPIKPSMESYSHKREAVEGLKVGVEWEIPKKLPPKGEAVRYLAYLIKKYDLLYEKDGSVEGGEFKTAHPVDIKGAFKLLYNLKSFRDKYPKFFESERINAGLHLHFNISDLLGFEKMNLKGFLLETCLLLEEETKDLLFALYGREFNRYCLPLKKGADRYSWVNLNNAQTVEFRLGNSKARGGAYITSLKASLYLFSKAREFVKNSSLKPREVVEKFKKLAPKWLEQA